MVLRPHPRRASRFGRAALATALAVSAVVTVGSSPAAAQPPAPAGATDADTPSAKPVGTVDVYGAFEAPWSLTAGPDGNMWFADDQANAVGRVTSWGEIRTYTATGLASPSNIVAGPDGALWFLNSGAPGLGRVTVDGTITLRSEARLALGYDLLVGPDDALWVAANSEILRIDDEGTVTTFVVGGGVVDVATGPDGAIWFADHAGDAIGRLTLEGSVTRVQDPAIVDPTTIVAGPDGALWFGGLPRTGIGRVTTAGVVTGFTSDLLDRPTALAAGPGGALWALNEGDGSIARIAADGTVTRYAQGTSADGPTGPLSRDNLAVAPDGSLWFTNTAFDRFHRVTPDGTITVAARPVNQQPNDLNAGPDGAMWFTNLEGSSIGRIAADGNMTGFAGSGIFNPSTLAIGPDGAVWFTNVGSVGRMTTDGTVTNNFTSVTKPRSIVTGSDGNLWMYDEATKAIVRMTTAGAVTRRQHNQLNAANELVAGPGVIWFVNNGTHLGQLDLATGAFTFHPPVTVNDRPRSLRLDTDGSLLFLVGAGTVKRLTAAGAMSDVYQVAGATDVTSVDLGPDGNLWFTERDAARVRRLQDGALTSLAAPGVREPSGLRAATDGSLWFYGGRHNALARVQAAVAAVGSTFHPVTPTRLLDSRHGTVWPGPLGGIPRPLVVTGGVVPVTATAVVLNVTVTDVTDPTYLTVFPAGRPLPTASNMNLRPGDTLANQVTVAVGANGAVSFRNFAGTASVIVDLVGYYEPASEGGRFDRNWPFRALDSRDGTGGWSGALPAGTERRVTVRGKDLLPSTATAAILNVTATDATVPTFVTAYPGTAPRPWASTVNLTAGATVANAAIVGIGTDGTIALFNNAGSVHLVVDVVGWYDSAHGAVFHPIVPTRALDTRVGLGATGPVGPNGSAVLGSDEFWAIPVNARGIVGNVTATEPTAGSFIALNHTGLHPARTSTLNLRPGRTVANQFTVGFGEGRWMSLYNAQGHVHLLVDIVGWFGPV